MQNEFSLTGAPETIKLISAGDQYFIVLSQQFFHWDDPGQTVQRRGDLFLRFLGWQGVLRWLGMRITLGHRTGTPIGGRHREGGTRITIMIMCFSINIISLEKFKRFFGKKAEKRNPPGS